MIKRLSEKIVSFKPSSSISSAALIISAAGILSRVIGPLRDRILASHFGAGNTLDAYYAAFRVPDLLYNLLILGALSAAFIPVSPDCSPAMKRKKPGKLADNLLNAALLALIVISAIFVIFTPWLMKIITPGFSGEKMAQVSFLTRIMFLSPIFLASAAIFRRHPEFFQEIFDLFTGSR